MTAARIEAARGYLAGAVAERRRAARPAGRAVTVGLLGRGIGASKTPRMHEYEGRRVGLDYVYELIDFDALELGDADLGAMVDVAEALGFAGLNVTHPFKQAILPLLDDLAPEAAAIGAVNTVVFDLGRRIGHNTDCWGFAESFREGLRDVPMSRVVQFGAGGAGAAVAHALLTLGTTRLVLCDTDFARAEGLARLMADRFGRDVTAARNGNEALARADGLVNATPVGMAKYPGVPFDIARLSARHWVAEIIYFPADTALLRAARNLGCRTLGGAGMAVYQAVKAFELFTGMPPDRAEMTAHFSAAA